MSLTTTTAYQINLILRQGSFILLSILLVKSGLSTDNIGVFETLMFISTTVSFFWLNALLQGILTQLAPLNDIEKQALKFNIFLITNILSITIFFILMIFKKPFLLFFTTQPELPHFEIFCIYILLNLPPYILESFWIVENRPLSILAYSALSHILLPLSIMLPIWMSYSFEVSVWGMVVVSIIRYSVLIINILQNGIFEINRLLIQSFMVLCRT